jgi:response regulator NasT
MTKPLRIVVADDEPDMQQYFRKILPRLGHQVVGVAGNGRELVAQCQALQPDLVITDIKMPEMDGIEAATQIHRERPIPVILVSAYHDPELIARAEGDHILGYLVKPIKQADLGPTIALAMRHFAEFQELDGLAKPTPPMEEQTIIGQAKAVIMKRSGIDEASAAGRLQKFASDRNVQLVEAARTLLTANEAFLPPPDASS